MPPISTNLGTACFLLVVAVCISLLLRRSYRYFGKKKQGRGEAVVRMPRPQSGRWSTNIDSPEQVAKFEVQMQETMRELSAQLDNKMICLQVLIRQANEKIARLEALQQSLDPAAVEAQIAGNENPADIGSLISEGPALDPALLQVYELADQGFSAVTIAHRVARPLSEIEGLLQARAKR